MPTLFITSNTTRNYAYGYSYDYAGRLKSADFRNSEGTWTTQGMDFSVSNLNYDANSNITSLNQKGPGSSTPTTIDQLSYTYAGNQLTKVEDAITTNYGNGDFENTNGSNTDYDYDANGNLTLDNNKGITSITYTYFNKPQVITFSTGKSISYSYNAAGAKVQEKIIDPSASNKTTNYVGNYIYDGSQLSYVLTGDGRSVYNKDDSLFKEEYFVKDHLGNVRSVVDVHNYPVTQYLASYEIASANLENLFFDNIDQVRDDKPGATWNGDLKSARLNGDDADRRTGTSLLLKVMAGDQVEMNVNNFYDGYDANADGPLGWEEMMTSVINTLTGGQGGTVEGEFHDVTKIEEKFTGVNMEAFENLVQGATDPAKPKAYLNYILFDENMRIVESASGSFQANGNGIWTQIGTATPMLIPQNGYLAVYLENRSRLGCGTCGDVFFDQLTVRFSKGVLKEESHYYPFGLPIKNMGSTASGFTTNRRKYQSNEYITEAGLNWMDFNNRQYDPQICRFLQVDPMAKKADMMSPYAAMNNEPVLNVDPLGLFPSVPEGMKWNFDRGSLIDIESGILGRLSQGFREWMKQMQPLTFSDSYNQAQHEKFLKENEERRKESEGEKDNHSGYASNSLGGEDNSKTFSLKGNLGSVYPHAQEINENYCSFYSLAWIDYYRKNIEGDGGIPRHAGIFAHMNGDKPTESRGVILQVMEEAGMATPISNENRVLQVGQALEQGNPVIAIEHSAKWNLHAVVIVSIYIPNMNRPGENVITMVYDPDTGRIERRPNDYWTNGKGVYHQALKPIITQPNKP